MNFILSLNCTDTSKRTKKCFVLCFFINWNEKAWRNVVLHIQTHIHRNIRLNLSHFTLWLWNISKNEMNLNMYWFKFETVNMFKSYRFDRMCQRGRYIQWIFIFLYVICFANILSSESMFIIFDLFGKPNNKNK